MPPKNFAKKATKAAAKIAEGIAAALLAALFFVFLLQIFWRYALSAPLGWTLELCLALWVWLVFFGCAFVVRRQDHIAFDLLVARANARWRRRFALLAAAAAALAMAAAFLPTWDFIDFLKIKPSATLGVPMRTVFSIYAVFMLSVIVSSAARFYFVWRRGLPPEEPPKELLQQKSGGKK